MTKILIIGAGISGLALAYRLQQRLPNANITLLDKCARPGGTVQTQSYDGFRVEAGPNGFVDTKTSTLDLCRDLGLADRLIPASAAAAKKRYLFVDGQLKLLPHSFGSFLGSDVLSWRGKLALLLERVRSKGSGIEEESIDAFVRRRAGAEAADVLADAMVTGIFAGDPKLLSVAACFPRLTTLEQEYGSILKGMAQSAKKRRQQAKAAGKPYQRPGRMWSFPEGLGLLIDTLVAHLAQPPVLDVAVQTIRANDSQWTVTAADGRQWHADAVILTCPAHQQATMLADVDGVLAENIAAIPYNSIAVVALGYHRGDIAMSVDGFGYISPQQTRRDVLGVQWCSSIFPGRAPDDCMLLRALCGGWFRPDIAAWDDATLLQAVRAELHAAMGITAEPMFVRVVRWPKAIPQYHVGHLERVRRIEERLRQHRGLFVGGNAYHGVALNDCTEQAQLLAEKVAANLI